MEEKVQNLLSASKIMKSIMAEHGSDKSIPWKKAIDLPEFSMSIPYINKNCSQAGIYCLEPLYLRKAFEILSEEDLLITGQLLLPDYTLKIASKGSFMVHWCRHYNRRYFGM